MAEWFCGWQWASPDARTGNFCTERMAEGYVPDCSYSTRAEMIADESRSRQCGFFAGPTTGPTVTMAASDAMPLLGPRPVHRRRYVACCYCSWCNALQVGPLRISARWLPRIEGSIEFHWGSALAGTETVVSFGLSGHICPRCHAEQLAMVATRREAVPA